MNKKGINFIVFMFILAISVYYLGELYSEFSNVAISLVGKLGVIILMFLISPLLWCFRLFLFQLPLSKKRVLISIIMFFLGIVWLVVLIRYII